jgi:glutamyl-tRNA synthetase
MGMTHIIRGKEHYTNMVRQKYMYQHLGWEYPEAIHYGRLKITGAFLSKSKIIQGVKEGIYTGFDDPRLGTFAALRKRGITPEAIKKMMIDVGTKSNDVTLSWENLFSYNRRILDTVSDRYFFVSEAVELKVVEVPKIFQAKLPFHPDKPERGFREYAIIPRGDEKAASFWVSEKDAENLEVGKVVRLMELFNVKVQNKTNASVIATFASESYEDVRKTKVQLIQWILKGEEFPCQVVMPDASINKGFAESACKKLKPDAIIQFERFGFTRINEVNQKIITYYGHK